MPKSRQKTFCSGIEGEPMKRFCHLPEDDVIKSSISVENKDSGDEVIVQFDDRTQTVVKGNQFPEGKYIVKYQTKTEENENENSK